MNGINESGAGHQSVRGTYTTLGRLERDVAGGLDTPTAGTVSIEGVDLASLSRPGLDRLRRRTMGFVFQAST